MSEIIGSYQVTNFTTPVNGGSLDASVVLSNDNVTRTNHNSHDNDPGVHFQSSTLAARPAAGTLGRKWFTTDGLRVYYDTGAAWSEIDYLCKTAGGTVAGATTFSATLTTAAINASGSITDTAQVVFAGSGRGTLNQYLNLVNTGANLALLIEGSVAGVSLTGSLAYASVLYSANATALQLGSNGSVRLTIDSAGLAAFTGAVSIGATPATAGILRLPYAQVIAWRDSGNASNAGQITYDDVAGGLLLVSGGTTRVTVGTSGQLLIGTTVTTGTNAGDLVIANNKTLRNVNVAGTGMISLIGSDGGDHVQVGGAPSIIMLGAPASVTSAAAGEAVVAQTKALRSVTAAGTSTYPLINGATLSGFDYVQLGAVGSVVGIGAPATLTGTGAGEIVLAFGKTVRGANGAGTGTVQMLGIGTGDKVAVAPGGDAVVSIGSAIITSAAVGEAVLANNKALRSVTAAGTDTFALIKLDSANVVYLGNASVGVAVGAPGSVVSAGVGELILGNNKRVRWSNAAGTDTVKGIVVSNDNNVWIADAGTAVIALGNPATLAGAAGGDAALANNSWLRGANAANTAQKALIGLSSGGKVAIDADAIGASFGAGAVFAGALSGITTLAMGGALSGVTTIAMSSTLTGATRLETGKLKGNSGTPGITPNSGLGTTGTATVTGTDLGGRITITPGGTGIALQGTAATVTFNSAYSATPVVLITFSPLTAANFNNSQVTANNITTTGFDLYMTNFPTSGVTFHLGYIVIAL